MEIVLEDFEKAISRLDEALSMNKTTVTRDSAIKRFELTFDLSWKLLKKYLQKEGVECYSPRSCFRSAFQTGIIEHDTTFLQMINDRNKSVHIYHEEFADQVYAHLNKYKDLFEALLKNFKSIS